MNLDCEGFEDRIDHLDAGTLSAQEREAAVAHMASCSRCLSLARAVRGESPDVPAELGLELMQAIMDRTSGSACPLTQSWLCDWADGMIGSDNHELIALHLASCVVCRNLADVLMELRQSLPEMAALPPDRGFVEDVLALTTERPAPVPFDRPRSACRNLWLRWIQRPRFAWEAAYVGAMLTLLILGNPMISSEASQLPQRLLHNGDLVLHGTTSALADTRQEAQHSLAILKAQGAKLWNGTSSFTTRTAWDLRDGAISILEALKDEFAEEPPSPPSDGRR
jgi:hypothetical protein